MSVTRIASRYAKSLLELAIEQNKLETIFADVKRLKAATDSRDFYMLLKSPIVSGDKKVSVLNAIFEGKLDTLTLAYLRLLVLKGREAFVPEIAAEFVHQYKVMKHITTAKVTSAAPLSSAVLEDIKKRLLLSSTTSDQIEIETAINPKLIGGFVVEYDDKRYDASLSNKLVELKSEFNKNDYIKEF